ncbi:uncharacterized protein LOC142221864 [Haematobia irritans]|uniref:uncharacterized protein LOC142221864 n=1 Tax=Haematobia irritans TaxID=7368 RepID=UPI003F504845
MNIKLQLEKLLSTKLCSLLIEAVNKRNYMLFDNDLFVTAIFLDPRIKVSLSAEHITRAKNCICQLNTRISSLKGNDSTISTSSTENLSTTSGSTSVLSTTEDALEAYLKNFDKPSCSQAIITNIESDLVIYERQCRIGISENIIEFWKREKNSLTTIAYIVLAIPCTQVSVERLFSSLKYILADQRNKLTSTSLEHILLTRVNGIFEYDD